LLAADQPQAFVLEALSKMVSETEHGLPHLAMIGRKIGENRGDQRLQGAFHN